MNPGLSRSGLEAQQPARVVERAAKLLTARAVLISDKLPHAVENFIAVKATTLTLIAIAESEFVIGVSAKLTLRVLARVSDRIRRGRRQPNFQIRNFFFFAHFSINALNRIFLP